MYVRGWGVRHLHGMRWGAAEEQQCLMTAGAVQSISCDLRMCLPFVSWCHLGWALWPSFHSPHMAALTPGLGVAEKGLDTGCPG